MMKPSEWLFDFLKKEEGYRESAYQDARGVWTIGYGHTHNVSPSTKASPAIADMWLREDVQDTVHTINQAVHVPLTQPQFDALVSLVFNIGAPKFLSSTLLKKLNEGDYRGAADQFLLWRRAGPHKDILLPRRKRERERFLSGTS